MSYGRQKPVELIQAQIEHFIDPERVVNFDERIFLFENSGALARREGLRLDDPIECFGLRGMVVGDLVRKYHARFLAFLRAEQTALDKKDIVLRRELIEKKGNGEGSEVEKLHEVFRAGEGAYQSFPEFLGKGAHGAVFALSWAGQDAVVKFVFDPQVLPYELEGLVAIKGVLRTPDILAVDYRRHALIMTRQPGVNLWCLPEPPNFQDSELIDIIETVIQLYERGVQIDGFNDGNLLYSPEKGICIVDLWRPHRDFTLAQEISSLCYLISSFPFSRGRSGDELVGRRIYQELLALRLLKILHQHFNAIFGEFRQLFKCNGGGLYYPLMIHQMNAQLLLSGSVSERLHDLAKLVGEMEELLRS